MYTINKSLYFYIRCTDSSHKILSITLLQYGCLTELRTSYLELPISDLSRTVRQSLRSRDSLCTELQNKHLRYREIFNLLMADKCNFELFGVATEEIILHCFKITAM